MSVTVRDLARLAGVSISTVSRVLNDAPNVDESTREHVLSVMKETGYVRRRRAPAVQPVRNVCIVLSDTTDRSVFAHPTVYTILGGLTARLTELGVGNTLYMLGDAEEGSRALLASRADAFLFIRTRREQEDVVIPKLLAEKSSVPVMAVNRRLNDKRVSYVNIDDYGAALRATEYLIRLGHTAIGIVNGDPSMRNSQLRLEGFLSAMKKHRLTVRPEFILSGAYSEDFGREAAGIFAGMDASARPTAVFTTSDVLALGLSKALFHLGWRLPRDLSIVGFGDTELASCMNPALTTIRIPAREMGVQAANAIHYLMNSPSIQNIKIVMRSELCIRDSAAEYPQPDGRRKK